MFEKKLLTIAAIAVVISMAVLMIFTNTSAGSLNTPMNPDGSYTTDSITENLRFGKNMDIWFMLMLVAFLMIFIRKFEWGVALAVLLSAAGSFVAYLAIRDFCFGQAWDQVLLIQGVICSITLVIAIGVFLGTVKMWQYLVIGVLFAPVYAFIEWFMGNVPILGSVAADPGGSMLVHMCAAYFGLGVALALRNKKAFDEPMYTTKHSVTFVWLASMLLWILWPSFVSSLLSPDNVTWATITCYMAGIGSIISTYIVCQIVQKKINPLIFTYAMLAGPVAIGAPLLIVNQWGALLIGLIAGAISSLAFIYLQPWFCKKIGVLDVMGVHNLHGIGGWVGVFASAIVLGSLTNIIVAVIVVAIAIIGGAAIGLFAKLTIGNETEIMTDDTDFISNDEPVAEHLV